MLERASPITKPDDRTDEVARLNKIIRALMDRAERNANVHDSEFSLFQTRIMLENEVRSRTAELEAALRENEKITRALRESEMKFRGVVSQSLVGIITIEDDRFTYSNARFNEMFGYSEDEVRRLGPLDLAVESDRPLIVEQLRTRLSGETASVHYMFRGVRKDGAVRDIECYGNGMDINGRRVLMSLVMDVTERTSAERAVTVLQGKLRDQSTHDALTGLYNRRYLDEYLERELELFERTGRTLSVIMGDLDHFKVVNDRFGHLAGDEALRVFGQLMKAHARSDDVYCRYGGEEFLLVLPGVSERRAAERAEQLRAAMADTPVNYNGEVVAITVSFGVASFPGDARTADELVAAADRALYAAKAAGRNRVETASTPTEILTELG